MKNQEYSFLPEYMFNDWYDDSMIYGFIYVTILPDLRFYIGQKKNDGKFYNYFGSGKIIKQWFEENLGFKSKNCPYEYACEHGVTKIVLDYAIDQDELNLLERSYIYRAKCLDYNNNCLNKSKGGGVTEFRIGNPNQTSLFSEKAHHNAQKTKEKKKALGLNKPSEETLRKRGESIKQALQKKPIWNKGLTKETDERVKEFAKKRKENMKPISKEQRKTISKATKGKKWWNNGIIQVRSKECPEGFVHGMLDWKKGKKIVFSEEHKRHLKESKQKNKKRGN